RPHREWIERSTDSEDDADRPPGDLSGEVCTLGPRCVHGGEQAPPAFGILVAIGQQEPDRTARLLCEMGHPGQLCGLIVEVAVHSECTRPDEAECRADAHQLVATGVP